MEKLKIKVIGAGSIGCHLSHAARTQDWNVSIYDRDQAAISRAQNLIFPNRYGSWDSGIKVIDSKQNQGEVFDVVFIGTPPNSHIEIAKNQIEQSPPKILVIEKPLSEPGLGDYAELRKIAAANDVRLLVGYNHRLTKSTVAAVEQLRFNPIGNPVTIRSLTRENWGGILAAHPWISGPEDTYLGYLAQGGGALFEHSHATNIFQYFAEIIGAGKISHVSCEMDIVERSGMRYDQITQLSVRTESGLLGLIVQDVVTKPSKKWLRIEGTQGFLEWDVKGNYDTVTLDNQENRTSSCIQFSKNRPDDFIPEMLHIKELIKSPNQESPIDIIKAIETTLVLNAAIESARTGTRISVSYNV